MDRKRKPTKAQLAKGGRLLIDAFDSVADMVGPVHALGMWLAVLVGSSTVILAEEEAGKLFTEVAPRLMAKARKGRKGA